MKNVILVIAILVQGIVFAQERPKINTLRSAVLIAKNNDTLKLKEMGFVYEQDINLNYCWINKETDERFFFENNGGFEIKFFADKMYDKNAWTQQNHIGMYLTKFWHRRRTLCDVEIEGQDYEFNVVKVKGTYLVLFQEDGVGHLITVNKLD